MKIHKLFFIALVGIGFNAHIDASLVSDSSFDELPQTIYSKANTMSDIRLKDDESFSKKHQTKKNVNKLLAISLDPITVTMRWYTQCPAEFCFKGSHDRYIACAKIVENDIRYFDRNETQIIFDEQHTTDKYSWYESTADVPILEYKKSAKLKKEKSKKDKKKKDKEKSKKQYSSDKPASSLLPANTNASPKSCDGGCALHDIKLANDLLLAKNEYGEMVAFSSDEQMFYSKMAIAFNCSQCQAPFILRAFAPAQPDKNTFHLYTKIAPITREIKHLPGYNNDIFYENKTDITAQEYTGERFAIVKLDTNFSILDALEPVEAKKAAIIVQPAATKQSKRSKTVKAESRFWQYLPTFAKLTCGGILAWSGWKYYQKRQTINEKN